MDISRPDIKKKKLRRQIVVLAIVAVGVTAAAWAVMRLKPAVPSVDASTVWPETVKRGDFTRNVRGLGTLVPREESIELIPAQTDATVVRIRVLPGTIVKPDTVLMDLTDPTLQQQLVSARLALAGAEADYKSLQATLNSSIMDKKSAAAQVNAQYSQAQLQSDTDKQLYKLGVISGIQYNQSKNNADQLTTQHQISGEQLDVNQKAILVQLQSQ
ncbi:MAG: RND transporter, partial [Acidobacteriaceae bacterium]